MVQYGKGQVSDREDILDFGNYVFSQAHQPHDFKKLVPKLYGEDSHTEQYHYLAKEDGKIKAMICALPGRLVVAGQELKTSGIGTVSVHPYARGKGYMKKLMAMAEEEMKAQGCDMGVLSGQRQRYGYFGYEKAGVEVSFLVTATNLRHCCREESEKTFRFAPLEEASPFLEQAYELYQSLPVCGARPKAEFCTILRSWQSEPLAVLKDGDFAGYLTLGQGGALAECELINPDDYIWVLQALMREKNLQEFHVLAAAYDTRKISRLLRFCERYTIETSDNFRIFHYQRVLSAYLALKNQVAPLYDGSLVVAIEGEQPLKISVAGGATSVCPTKEAPQVKLTAMEAVPFFFSPIDARRLQEPVPAGWLPLPLFLPKPDCC